MNLLPILDSFFFLFHSLWILWILVGALTPWKKIHFLSLLLTLFSWLILGYFYGLGYCFLTDWHWEIKEALGEKNLPPSFVEYLIEKTFSIPISSLQADIITATSFFLSFVISFYKNFLCRST